MRLTPFDYNLCDQKALLLHEKIWIAVNIYGQRE